MSGSDGTARRDWAEGSPERLYVVTMGRNRPPGRVAFDLVTLIVARNSPGPGMHPEHAAILRMCTNPLSIAELSAHLSLPVSTISVLTADLVDTRQVEVRAPLARRAVRPRATLLEAVIDGLSKL